MPPPTGESGTGARVFGRVMGARAQRGIRVSGAKVEVAPNDRAALERLEYGEARGEGMGTRSAVMCISSRASRLRGYNYPTPCELLARGILGFIPVKHPPLPLGSERLGMEERG